MGDRFKKVIINSLVWFLAALIAIVFDFLRESKDSLNVDNIERLIDLKLTICLIISCFLLIAFYAVYNHAKHKTDVEATALFSSELSSVLTNFGSLLLVSRFVIYVIDTSVNYWFVLLGFFCWFLAALISKK